MLLKIYYIKLRSVNTCSNRAVVRGAKPKTTAPVVTIFNAKYSTVNEAEFEVMPYKLHRLEYGPPAETTVTVEEAKTLYKNMVCSRRLETASAALFKEKVIRGFCHLYNGQEAVAVGIRAAYRVEKDSLIAGYRFHPIVMLWGVTSLGVLAELAGRQAGCSRGKGGSAHMYAHKLYGGNGILGANCPLATGVAFAHKYREDGGVALCMYGDGSANQGQIFESYNIAKLWNLPIVYICENNGVGYATLAERSAAVPLYYTRGDYIPGIQLDGQDVLATRDATRFAIEYCAAGKGPIILEMKTYRYTGHSLAEPGTTYRTREEVMEWRKNRDPITNFKKRLTSSELVSEEDLKAIDKEVKNEIDPAVERARKEQEAPVTELTADLYVHWQGAFVRGISPLTPLKHIEIAPRGTK